MAAVHFYPESICDHFTVLKDSGTMEQEFCQMIGSFSHGLLYNSNNSSFSQYPVISPHYQFAPKDKLFCLQVSTGQFAPLIFLVDVMIISNSFECSYLLSEGEFQTEIKWNSKWSVF